MPMNPRLLRPIASGVHPEAAAWRTAVVANGGSVSASTMRAVSKFCADIDAAGIRDRFYRLNLFCGNSDASLNAVRTPLYRGQSRTGTQYGGTTDTNNNFVQGDYAENDGLLGNGSTKWLNTGFNLNAAGLVITSGHMSCVVPAYTQGASLNMFAIAAINAAANERFWLNFVSAVTPTTNVNGYWSSGSIVAADNIAATNGAAIPGGLWTINRTAATDLRLYNGATERAVATTFASGGVPTNDMSIFVRWNGSSTFGFFNQRLRAYSVGLGMTAQQVTDFNTAMSALQTALGRT